MKSAGAAPPRHLAIVGMMGSGKSVAGRQAAQMLGRRFLDIDEAVEKVAGMTIPELFETSGEEAFREAEAVQLIEALETFEPLVVACGGGAVLSERNQETLAEGAHVVWLRAAPASLARRVGNGRGRPLLAGTDVEAELSRISAEREDLYHRVADSIIDVDKLTLDQVARALADTVRVAL